MEAITFTYRLLRNHILSFHSFATGVFHTLTSHNIGEYLLLNSCKEPGIEWFLQARRHLQRPYYGAPILALSVAITTVSNRHIFVLVQAAWFNDNGMQKYNTNLILYPDVSVDDISNALILRANIHEVFDDMALTIVPKESQWVTHFLRTTQDLGQSYHNTKLQLPRSISVGSLLPIRLNYLLLHSTRSDRLVEAKTTHARQRAGNFGL